jgi:PAS domain S-box-containing protein
MNDSTVIPLHILHIAGSPEDERPVMLQLERDGFKAEYQRVDNETDFIAALAPPPDLVLFDLSVAQFSCLNALGLLKERGLDIPIILISDTDGQNPSAAALQQGAENYVTKDHFARLGFAVQRALEEKRVRQSEERYRGIFENATVAIWDEDFSQVKVEVDRLRADGVGDIRGYIKEHPEFLQRALKLVKILDANEATLRLYNVREKAEVLGDLDKFVSPETFREELIAFAEGKSYFEREIQSQSMQGKLLDFLMTITYYQDPTGRSKALVHLSDITERKQAERALRESEARYRAVVENQTEFIVRWKPDGTRTFVNEAYRRYFGLTFEQAISSGFIPLIVEEDQQMVEEKISRLLSGTVASETDIHRVIKPDGTIGWQEWIDQAIYNEDEQIAEFQSVGRDITERKVSEENIRSQNEYLGLLNEMTRAILLSKDFDSTLYTLAVDMVKLIHADDCYIARWDEERQTVIPVAATMSVAGIRPSYRETRSEDLKMALAVLNVGQALAADDVYDSPYINVDLAKNLHARSALGIPLIAGEYKLGAAIIVFNTPHHFTPDEIERAAQAGNQVALALWNFQQSVEIQQRLRESNTLAKIERALSESERIGTGEVLQLIVDSARELMPNAEKSVIHLLEAENILLARAVSGYDGQAKESTSVQMHLGEGVAGKVIREGITVNVADIHANPDFLLKDSSPEFRSLLVAPVQSSGQHIGTISLQSHKTNAFTNKDAALLKALAVQAAIAIENTRLFERTQQSLKEVNILYQISRGLAASLDLDELIRNVISLLQQIFGYYHVQIYLIDPENGNLVVKHGSGYIGSELVQQGHFLPAGEGIVGHVAETGEPFITNNVEDVVFFKRNLLLPQTQSEVAVPIKIDQQMTGVLDIQQIPPHRLTESDLRLMTAIADQLAVVLQKANLYKTLQTSLQQEQMVRSQLIQSERLALVGRLLASVSHELNNPLQAIHNALFLLKEETDLSHQARQDLDVILSEAERMAALIERLRSAYRPIRIKDFQPVELNSLIEDVHALISTHMRQKEIVFEFLPDADLPEVSGLPDQLRQVVLNLFLNAIEVMRPGGRLTVWTRGFPEQKEVFFRVKDSGPGIDSEIMPIIFDAFITSKHTGTGLGLTITHDIIQQHHGRITAENDLQGGAAFNIWLPIHEGGGK